MYICTNYDFFFLHHYNISFPFFSVQNVSTITYIYIYCKIFRLRCELGIGLLLKPCLCKGEECVCIYPKLTINNDCIQHRTLNLLQSLKNAEFPPEISIFYKQMKIVDDELCRSYLSIFMRKKMNEMVRSAHIYPSV